MTTANLEKLIQMLRKNGVFYYKTPELEMHIKPPTEVIQQEQGKDDEELTYWSTSGTPS